MNGLKSRWVACSEFFGSCPKDTWTEGLSAALNVAEKLQLLIMLNLWSPESVMRRSVQSLVSAGAAEQPASSGPSPTQPLVRGRRWPAIYPVEPISRVCKKSLTTGSFKVLVAQ